LTSPTEHSVGGLPAATISPEDSRRRKREGILIIVIVLLVALLTFAETKLFDFGERIPVSNTVLMFILININLLLLLLLIFLVFRNLVKLLYDRRRKVMGANLRTRLVVAFIALTLVPTGVLFYFSLHFITSSLEFWFNIPIEQSLENSLWIGQQFYRRSESTNAFFLERILNTVLSRKLLEPDRRRALAQYAGQAQREMNLDAVEIYTPSGERITFSLSNKLENEYFGILRPKVFRKALNAREMKTVTQDTPSGELIKTIASIPLNADPQAVEGFAVATVLLPSELSANLRSVTRGVEEYEQIKLVQKPIQLTYYTTLSIVLLVVLFFAIWFGFLLAKTISIPIKELAEATRRVAEGDLAVSIAPVADYEIGSLVDAFNRMTRDLRANRRQLEVSAQILREQNVEIEAKRQYMEIVLGSVSAGVLTLDADGRIATLNRSAERMLKCQAQSVRQRDLNILFPSDNGDLASEIMKSLALQGDSALEISIRLTIEGKPRSFLAVLNALRDYAGRRIGTVVVLDDLTELEKAQRMTAWREVARRIAHEVKNPLTPITLSAERLKRKYAGRIREPVFDECTQTIIEHVDLIRNLVNEFSAYARFPSADPKPCDLRALIDETIALYRDGYPAVEFSASYAEPVPILSLDRQQMKQALINLIENAIVAIKERGRISISLRYDSAARRLTLAVADDGPGVPDRDKTRLFEPNFSTKKSGMGLGLTIVSSIIADHNGLISVQDNKPTGARFVIELPA
jgi:two-component system nitrogen regulation sensor histidine kinase NtrY